MSTANKTNYLKQINGHFLSCINTKNELAKSQDNDLNLAYFISSLQSKSSSCAQKPYICNSTQYKICYVQTRRTQKN